MQVPEFRLIEAIRDRFDQSQADIELGIGDDAAVFRIPDQQSLVVSTDTLNEGVHFLPGTAPNRLGHKALAVNLSDLAAMAAKPRWILLNLSLPRADEDWVNEFIGGVKGLASMHGVMLVGGDTCRGPLSITITAMGTVRNHRALRRSGAQPGDQVFVSGELGDAAWALQQLKRGCDIEPNTIDALELPSPRVDLGLAIGDLASSCIDVSDGLLADLGHITRQSHCGAEIRLDRLPSSHDLSGLDMFERAELQLGGGDDYELCFTVPLSRSGEVEDVSSRLGIRLSHIGQILEGEGVVCLDPDGKAFKPATHGHQHFEPVRVGAGQ